MTTLLRRSGNLARISRSVRYSNIYLYLPYTRRFVQQSPHLKAIQSRFYATVKPEDRENSKDGADTGSKVEGGSAVEGAQKGSKAARGFENLYSNGGPLSGPSFWGPSDGFDSVKLSEVELKAIESLKIRLKKILPVSQYGRMEQSLDRIKQEGLPPELMELATSLKNGAPLDLATVAKLIRLTSKYAMYAAEQQVKQEKNTKVEGKANVTADAPKGTKPTGQSPKKKQDQQSSSEGFKIGDIKIDMGTLVLTLFTGYLLYRMAIPSESQKEITWQEFRTTFFDKGLVNKLTVVNNNRVRVELHREATAQMYPESPAQYNNFFYYFTVGSVEAFERRLDDAQNELKIPNSERIPVAYTHEISWLGTFLSSVGPTLFLIGALYWMSRRAAGGSGGQSGIFGIGKSRAKRFNHESDIQTKFKDVAGMDEAKAEIMEFVSFLKSPGRFQRLGAKIPRGAILSGPPGTGKTLLAKATAGESQVPFFSVSGSEFMEMFVGVGPSRVRDLFANARKNTPCIIFIDEIDAIGKARGKGNFSGGNDERESTLNQILTEMDGFNTSEQVVVLAGTNRPDVLDKALLRPGRFDRHISIDRPTMEGRKQIFLVHLGKIVTGENMDHLTGRLSALTPGFSGADIANCVNEAALIGGLPSPLHLLEKLLTSLKQPPAQAQTKWR